MPQKFVRSKGRLTKLQARVEGSILPEAIYQQLSQSGTVVYLKHDEGLCLLPPVPHTLDEPLQYRTDQHSGSRAK
jgi:hypothetical protein